MNILIIGSGGREYAIALKLKSEKNINLYFAPGNGATSRLGENLSIKDFHELANFAKKNSIELTIVGPEAPLSEVWWISLKKRVCSSLDQAKQLLDLRLARPI